MKLIGSALVALTLYPGSAVAETPAAEISHLQLYSSFWQNLHHYLYVSAWASRPVVPRSPRLAMPLPESAPVSMTNDEQTAWDAAVSYYDRELASNNLLFGAGMTEIKLALADADDGLSGTNIKPELRATLLAAAPIYRRYWWRDHDTANRAWIADVSQRTTSVAAPIIERLTALYGVPWFTTPVRVDVVRVGQRQGAYTSNQPRPHIVVASADRSYDGWAGTEMLFHESSHALIMKVRAAIDSAAALAHKNPRDLWHVVLFYIAGEVTRQTLAAKGIEYQPYLYATGLFDVAWPEFKAPVERHVRAFVDGQKPVDQMAADLIEMLP
jgi:hypothetical protein